MKYVETFNSERRTRCQRIKEISQCARDSEGVILCPRGRCFGYITVNTSSDSFSLISNNGKIAKKKNGD